MFEQEIACGVAVLDEHSTQKTGWVFHVDTDTLDMADWSKCVLGQLYGEFFTAVEGLIERTGATQVHVVFAVSHGFDLPPNTRVPLRLNDYDVLTTEWRAHIAELRFQRRTLLDDAPEVIKKKEDT